jgi:hypothetical protein
VGLPDFAHPPSSNSRKDFIVADACLGFHYSYAPQRRSCERADYTTWEASAAVVQSLNTG